MSFQAMAWANAQKTGSPARRSLLIAIANYCDEKGVCWPSRKRLADDSEQSLQSVDRHIVALQEMGLLTMLEVGHRADGGRRTEIRLHLDQARIEACLRKHRASRTNGADEMPPAIDDEPASGTVNLMVPEIQVPSNTGEGPPNPRVRYPQLEGPGTLNLRGPLYTDEPVTEPVKEPVSEPAIAQAREAASGSGMLPLLALGSPGDPGDKPPPRRTADIEAFERWWARYPHKVSKAHAQAAFLKALRKPGVTLAVLLDGVERYVREKPPDRQWCNPATWLNGERWNDVPAAVFAPRNGPVPDSKRHPFAVLGDKLRSQLNG